MNLGIEIINGIAITYAVRGHSNNTCYWVGEGGPDIVTKWYMGEGGSQPKCQVTFFVHFWTKFHKKKSWKSYKKRNNVTKCHITGPKIIQKKCHVLFEWPLNASFETQKVDINIVRTEFDFMKTVQVFFWKQSPLNWLMPLKQDDLSVEEHSSHQNSFWQRPIAWQKNKQKKLKLW